MLCWHEECLLLTYEMHWTVHYFVNKSSIWQSPPARNDAGYIAYATWQAMHWTHLAAFADQAFWQINVKYTSPLHK